MLVSFFNLFFFFQPFLSFICIDTHTHTHTCVHFLKNGFIGIKFRYHTIHLLKFNVYVSVVFSIFTELCDHHNGF